MITKMEVFTPGVVLPPLPIVDQLEKMDPIQIKKIDGLGPVTATVNTTQYGSVDGEFYFGSSTPKRNIVITVGLNPDWSNQTIEGLRQILYSYFMPENKVRLQFTSTHLALVEITGYVESFEPDMFSRDPEYQISIICPQPYFTAVNASVVTGYTQDFTSPQPVTIQYEGTADVGFILDVSKVYGTNDFTGEVRIINNSPSTKLAIISTATASSAYRLRYSSVQGDKFVQEISASGSLPINYLRYMTAGSSWLSIRKGLNQMEFLTSTAGLYWTLTYYAKYGGL